MTKQEENLRTVRRQALLIAKPQFLVRWMEDWAEHGTLPAFGIWLRSDDYLRMSNIADALISAQIHHEWDSEYIAMLEEVLQDSKLMLEKISELAEVAELLPRIQTLLDTGLTPKRKVQACTECSGNGTGKEPVDTNEELIR